MQLQRESPEEEGAPEPEIIISGSRHAELIPATDSRAALAYPIEVVPSAVVSRLERMNASALAIEIADQDGYARASELLQALGGEIRGQDERVTELRRPYGKVQDRISEESKKHPALALARDQALPALRTALAQWLTAEKKREEAARAEALRISQENERKRREAEAERAREEAKLRTAAEAKQRGADRLRFEAEERERLATEALQGKRDAGALDAGLENLAQAEERERLATEAQTEADELARKLAASQSAPIDVQQTIVPEIVESVPVRGGAKLKEKPVIDDVNLEVLPAEYRLADEAKIRKALGMGLKVPGVAFHMVPDVQAKRGPLR